MLHSVSSISNNLYIESPWCFWLVIYITTTIYLPQENHNISFRLLTGQETFIFPHLLVLFLGLNLGCGKKKQSCLSVRYTLAGYHVVFLVLDDCNGWLRLKSGPFIAIATVVQDRDPGENVCLWVCVCTCGIMGRFYRPDWGPDWEDDKLVNISIRSNCYTLHTGPLRVLPLVQPCS